MTRSARWAPHRTSAAIGSPCPREAQFIELKKRRRRACRPRSTPRNSGRPTQAAGLRVAQRSASLWLTDGDAVARALKPGKPRAPPASNWIRRSRPSRRPRCRCARRLSSRSQTGQPPEPSTWLLQAQWLMATPPLAEPRHFLRRRNGCHARARPARSASRNLPDNRAAGSHRVPGRKRFSSSVSAEMRVQAHIELSRRVPPSRASATW